MFVYILFNSYVVILKHVSDFITVSLFSVRHSIPSIFLRSKYGYNKKFSGGMSYNTDIKRHCCALNIVTNINTLSVTASSLWNFSKQFISFPKMGATYSH